MLSIFPELLNYSQLAVFLLRITLGALFVIYGTKKLFRRELSIKWKIIGAIEWVAGILLIIGFLTQLSALVISLLMLGALVIKIKTKNAVLKSGFDFYLLLFVIALSLLFLGPGLFAFDLPL